MHMVERAIIMAAGVGKRLRPITDTIPKPMVEVNGVRMVDTVIQGLRYNGIKEIYIVVGYLKEKFYSLKMQYPEINIIENPYYAECNNISSLYVARDYIENAIILDGDQYIYNYSILSPYFEYSGYNAVWTEQYTTEWLMQVENERVVSCSHTGGKKGWQLYSISRWTKADGIRLKGHLEQEFITNHNTGLYWDDVAMFLHFHEYELGIRKMNMGDIVEVDTLDELIKIDKRYIGCKERKIQ